MEELSALKAYARLIAETLCHPSDDSVASDLNEVVARFQCFGTPSPASSAVPSSDSTKETQSNILEAYGDSFYDETEFRQLSSSYAFSVAHCVDATTGWNKLRSLIWSSLLNPFTASDVLKEFPDIALSLLIDFLETCSQIDGLLLERLALLWRLRNDLRLRRKARKRLSQLLKSQETVKMLQQELDGCVEATEAVLLYKFRLFSFLSEAFQIQENLRQFATTCSKITSNSELDKFQSSWGSSDKNYGFPDLHVFVPTLAKTHFPLKNLVQIGSRVSHLRSPNVVHNDAFVELGYSSDLLSSMLCHLDASLGSIVSGDACKEFHIRELGNRVGMPPDRISRIYTDERTDVKTLVGQWICTEKVGEFKFNYGVLATAMMQGRWLIFDDNISDSIACLLHSICQQGSLIISELNEIVEASSDFHIFVTTKNGTKLGGNLNELPRTNIPALKEKDCVTIINSRYLAIRPICQMLVSGFFSFKDKLNNHKGLNISDLFRIAHRLNASGATFDGYLSSSTKGIILEAFYCVLLAGISCNISRIELLGDLAEHLGISRISSYGMLPISQIKDHDNTKVHAKVLHQLMSCYLSNEPVLLVGETGSGKTAIVQHFARITGNQLKVYVFSDQSEAEDLIGSFFPDNIADVSSLLFKRVLEVLLRCCAVDDELLCFLDHIVELFNKGLHKKLLRMLSTSISELTVSSNEELCNEVNNLRRLCNLRCGTDANVKTWNKLTYLQQPLECVPTSSEPIKQKYTDLMRSSTPNLQFKFEEGLLIQAMREGHWLLLDEVNLAPSDLLQRFVGILSRTVNTFELYECGNNVITIHENFRVFACMNPPTIRKGDFVTFTSGKKALPQNFRNRMTEIFVDAVDTIEDISVVVSSYVDKDDRNIPSYDICHFYLRVIEMCRLGELEDGAFKCPTFTLRNLVRTINYTHHVMKRHHRPIKDGREAFVEAALSCFASSLGPLSFSRVASLLPSFPPRASSSFEETVEYVKVEGYWIRRGTESVYRQEKFIVTPNVQKNLRRICRVLSGLRVPVLLEGPTACGKTSLVQYLSELTGHKCVRINNHEHSDLSEYLGQFVFDSVSNQLRFNYGPIVTAMREGHWVILDELNLAPSQILEALNRILDDNREVYIPETGETIKSHKEFMIFATQNPANSIYGGRKQLSKAFCNRFVQLYIDGLDKADLQQVLHQRCQIPLSRAEKIVSTFLSLKNTPMNSMTFERHSVLITLRDLIKWANRVRDDDEGLAYYGWCVIAEKLRDPLDKEIVKEVLEKSCLLSKPGKPKQLTIDYGSDASLLKFQQANGCHLTETRATDQYLWLDESTTRLVALLLRALENKEPVLLVGETGIGKTTVCQMLAKFQGHRMNILNLSKNTEASDFIGSFRPIRGARSFHANVGMLIDYFEGDTRCPELIDYLRELMTVPLVQVEKQKFIEILELISVLLEGEARSPEERQCKRQKMKSLNPSQIEMAIDHLKKSFSNALFEWVDGPLTRSMELGEWFLADEISLADDAVLEKMNSVLEVPSSLTIPEAGGETLRVVKAHSNFRFLATMNPSGDHGKRELSPALLNRFTVIYIPTPEFEKFETLTRIMDQHNVSQPAWVAHAMGDIIRLHNARCPNQKITLRDVVKWAEFMSQSDPVDSFLHGAHVVFLDNLAKETPGVTLQEVVEIMAKHNQEVQVNVTIERLSNGEWIHHMLMKLQKEPIANIQSYNIGSKNSLRMFGKIMRAMEVNRPILMEGEPGVGKSASIAAVASLHGIKLLRVNLSEHTDIMDLFGSDLPTVVDGTWKFLWHNGPVIEAAVNGHWIVLDELNLASQQVLEGLNALLDHRRETFIPELDRFIKCHENFRLFASQNSAMHGGGRKHLPKSFLNRFTRIYCQPLEEDDYCAILTHLYPDLGTSVVTRIVTILLELKNTNCDSTWDWNLRDCMRFCDALSQGVPSSDFEEVFRFVLMSRLSNRTQAEAMMDILGMKESSRDIPRFMPYTWDKEQHLQMDIDQQETTEIQQDKENSYQGVPQLKSLTTWPTDSIWMQTHEEVYNTVRMGAHLNFPVLLVAPSSTGKKSTIKCIATSCGQQLVELAMLPCFDTGDLLGGFEQVANSDTESTTGSFRWIDSSLVSAIENGNWLLLTRIHHANPAILDRLNSLLEVNGSLSLNESGNCNRVVKPHQNFRLFMTADTKQVGRLSRAFRNRCLEINMSFPSVMHGEQEAQKPSFMERIGDELGRSISELNMAPERATAESQTTELCKVKFKCSTLTDGARLVKSTRNYSWIESITMSLCNCAIGWYLNHLAAGDYRHYYWVFLKSWCMIDQPLRESTLEIARFFPQHLQCKVLQILECCLEWCSQNLTGHSQNPLSLLTGYLQRCKDFENRTVRDIAAADIERKPIDADSGLWFVNRAIETDYRHRCDLLLGGMEPSLVPRNLLISVIETGLRSGDRLYETHALLEYILFDETKAHERFGPSGFKKQLIEKLVTAHILGEPVKQILSQLQFVSYLFAQKYSLAPFTVSYIAQKLYTETVATIMGPDNKAQNECHDLILHTACFPDYSTDGIGTRLCCDVDLALELHKNGLGALMPTNGSVITEPGVTITVEDAKRFIEYYADHLCPTEERPGVQNPQVSLRMPQVEDPNPAITKFIHDRMRFLGYWICHQFLVGDLGQAPLKKLYDYSSKLLELHVEMQKDLPSSSLVTMTSVTACLLNLIQNPSNHRWVYQIMLETWSLTNGTGQELELDPLSYMVDLVNGKDLQTSEKKDPGATAHLGTLDDITSVMLFWKHVSSDNGIQSLQDNIKRIESLRKMLSETIPISQWSALFTTLTLVSPILTKALDREAHDIRSLVRDKYFSIIFGGLPEPVPSGKLDNQPENSKEIVISADSSSAWIVHQISSRIVALLSEITPGLVDVQGNQMVELWHMCGLLLIISLPNMADVINDVSRDLISQHRRHLKEILEQRIEKFVTLETLSDGECWNSYSSLRNEISVLEDGNCATSSLRFYTAQDESTENIGSADTVAMLMELKNDVSSFCQDALKCTVELLNISCDQQGLANFRRYLLRQYAVVPEVLRPILIGIDCLSFKLSQKSASQVQTKHPRTVQNHRVAKRCLQYPFNILKKVNTGDLLSLSARIYDAKGLYNIHCYLKSLVSSVRYDLLCPPSMEPIKYAVLLLSGMFAKLQIEREEGQEMRMSLLQSCIVMAQRNSDKSIHDLLPSQAEIVRAIIRDCGPLEEYETMEQEEDGPVEETESSKERRRITMLCRVITKSLQGLVATQRNTVSTHGDPQDTVEDEMASESDHRHTLATIELDQLRVTQQMNSALCLATACGSDGSWFSQIDESIFLARRLMIASEEHFGYRCYESQAGALSYKTVDIPCCNTAWDIISRLRTAVTNLLSQFSQQQLLDVDSMLTSISRVKLPTLTQVLLVTLLENLVARIHKWNNIAHSGISLRDLSSELETLILDLRRQELKGWFMAISDRLDLIRQDAYSCLAYFMEMCSSMHDAGTSLPKRISNCAAEIVQFSMSAPVAHFEPIIEMLRTVSHLYRDTNLAPEQAMRSTLENVLCFLELWRPTIEAHIESLKQESHKEINEAVKVINWSGTDYVSMSTLIHKQKAKLSAILRRFQEGILQPCATVYAAASMKWSEPEGKKPEEDETEDIEMTTDEDQGSIRVTLIECIRSNIAYVKENQKQISRVQITRITREVETLLTEEGYNAASGYDIANWLDWIDLGAKMATNGCVEAEKAKDRIMRALHVICDLKELFRRNKDLAEFFTRNVDPNLFGYLATMLRAAQSNMIKDVTAFLKMKTSQYSAAILESHPVYQIETASFEQLMSAVDDIYEAALQANDHAILNVPQRKNNCDEIARIETASPLLERVIQYRTSMNDSAEFNVYRLGQRATKTQTISSHWLESCEKFCSDVSNLAAYAAPASGFFVAEIQGIRDLLSRAVVRTEPLSVAPLNYCSKNTELPDACLYMAELIDCIAHVEPPQDEREQETKEEWAPGTGLEDGTGAKNVSEEVEPEDGMFDNFKNENPADAGEMAAENPSVDVDLEFEGDVMDLECSREASDIEEEENPGHNESFDDLKKEQLDEDLVDQEPPLEDNAENLDIDGVSMEDTKESTDDSKNQEVGNDQENNYSTELENKDASQDQPENAETREEAIDQAQEEDPDQDTQLQDQTDYETGPNEQEGEQDLNAEELAEDELQMEADDQMDTEDLPEGGEEAHGDEVNESDQQDDLAPDGSDHKDLSDQRRKEYQETPYGVEGKSQSNIQQEQENEAGGNSYEEDSSAGHLWGDTSRMRGGMLNFLEMIQKLEQQSRDSSDNDIPLRNITESITEGMNQNEHESMHNELDENSNLEGLSASLDGTAAPNAEIDMNTIENKQEAKTEMELSEGVDPTSASNDRDTTRPEHLETDEPMDQSPENSDNADLDTSAVRSGSTGASSSNQPPSELPSREAGSHQKERSVGAALWTKYREETAGIATTLCEQMRMILEPTLSASLQGDYKTGKRISIRKLMAFIASNYQRDKIWLRRSKPSKRDYRVVLAIDNSKSMSVSNAGNLALKSFACIYQAMSVLEVGKLSVCKFGGNVPELLLETDGGEDPSRVVAGMTFDEESRHSYETGLPELLKYMLRYLENQDEGRKIVVIISDGKFNKEKARPWIQATISNQVVPLLVILDPLTGNNKSILQMKHVKEIDGCLTVETFLSNFPFPYYAVIQNLDRLPSILSDLLRQWFALSNQR